MAKKNFNNKSLNNIHNSQFLFIHNISAFHDLQVILDVIEIEFHATIIVTEKTSADKCLRFYFYIFVIKKKIQFLFLFILIGYEIGNDATELNDNHF